MMAHSGDQGLPDMPATPDHRDKHCTPLDCAMTVHCSPAIAAPATPGALASIPRAPRLAPRTLLRLKGLALEPPTPPPNGLL